MNESLTGLDTWKDVRIDAVEAKSVPCCAAMQVVKNSASRRSLHMRKTYKDVSIPPDGYHSFSGEQSKSRIVVDSFGRR